MNNYGKISNPRVKCIADFQNVKPSVKNIFEILGEQIENRKCDKKKKFPHIFDVGKDVRLKSDKNK